MVSSLQVGRNNILQHSFNSTVKSNDGYYTVLPQDALNWGFDETVTRLKKLIPAQTVNDIFNGKTINGPNSSKPNSKWIEQTKIIGVHPRALGSYFDVVKYAMTFPEDSIHLLPLFEQGCNKSLYSPVNFKLSEEFLDKDLVKKGFDTPEKQLKLTINLLHALNKNVGMDFMQHTDRFSEEVFINPNNFSWLKLNNNTTKELVYPEIHPDKIGEDVQKEVIKFLRKNGDSNGKPISEMTLLNFYEFNEDKRRELLFGNLNENDRTKRRVDLMNAVRDAHLEPKPVSIEDAKRRISFKEMKSDNGVTWAEFTDNMGGKVYGSLAPFKLYHLDKNGEFDLSKPNQETWDFLCNKIYELKKEYGFDFLRADMGYLNFSDDKRDIHAKIKEFIQQKGNKSFGTFGECFHEFTPETINYVKAKNFDAILGSIQYKNVNDYNFTDYLKSCNLNKNFKYANTTITADSDQMRFNANYDNHQNKLRYFAGLFLNQPAYTGMGLETRDENPTEFHNLTKSFINDWGNKKYIWGNNTKFFKTISDMRKAYSQIKDTIQNQWHYWLNTSCNKVASWFYYSKDSQTPSYAFVTNTSNENKDNVTIQNIFDTNMSENISSKTNTLGLSEIYSSEKNNIKTLTANIMSKGKEFKLTNLAPGECRIYKIKSVIK